MPQLASWHCPNFAFGLIAAILPERASDVENQCHVELGIYVLVIRHYPFATYPPIPIPIHKPPAQLHSPYMGVLYWVLVGYNFTIFVIIKTLIRII